MDWIDRAVEESERATEIATQARRATGPTRSPDGLCANECGCRAVPGGAFCSAECRDDWDYRQARR